jgi:hypothetical protein
MPQPFPTYSSTKRSAETLALPAVGRRVLEYQTVTTPDNVEISERIIVRDYSMQGVKRSTS